VRRLQVVSVILLAASPAIAEARRPAHLSPTAYTAISRLYALLERFDAPSEPGAARSAFRRAVCSRLPGARGDRQARLVLDDCAAAAEGVGPATAVLLCAGPPCLLDPVPKVVAALDRSHTAEVRLAATVSGDCRTVLAGGARLTARLASAYRRLLRAAQAGSQPQVVRALFDIVDLDMAGSGFPRKLPACAP
jgi:hypothetical protein